LVGTSKNKKINFMTEELKRILDQISSIITLWNTSKDLSGEEFRSDLVKLNEELTKELSKPDSIEVAPGT